MVPILNFVDIRITTMPENNDSAACCEMAPKATMDQKADKKLAYEELLKMINELNETKVPPSQQSVGQLLRLAYVGADLQYKVDRDID